jgi:two-component sensor histidine kinase
MKAPTPLQPDDPTLSLALAMVCSSPTPLLLLNGSSKVIAASASFCQAFDIDPQEAVGRPIFGLGAGEWDAPQLRSLVEATAAGDAAIEAYELDVRPPNRAVRHLVLNVRKLDYGDSRRTRVMVAIADETEARSLAARGRALSENNALLLKESRHRIANSLQIIASVMMLKARRTASEETRGHLRDVHNRVMSVAQLQQQLAASADGDGDVAIRPYLTRLCQTITASMVADPGALSIVVTAPDISIDPDASVSLGLIVTELVINSLKHGFPNGEGGRIDVSFAGHAPAWTLSVSDTGVGIPKVAAKATPGLGSSIVQALAGQLGASVEVADASPGTRVSIVRPAHKQAGDGADPPRKPIAA